jgi:hypothetical protein
MTIYLVDGTYELFRHFYALPSAKNGDGEEVAAVRGVTYSIRALVREGATHIGVATDHVIESFRNDLWPGYKTGDGFDPALRAQFELLEEALRAWGLVLWPMVEEEADDALASAAMKAASDARVDQVIICSPDKDLAQCVHGTRVVQRDRVRKITGDEAAVVAKFGVSPASILERLRERVVMQDGERQRRQKELDDLRDRLQQKTAERDRVLGLYRRGRIDEASAAKLIGRNCLQFLTVDRSLFSDYPLCRSHHPVHRSEAEPR